MFEDLLERYSLQLDKLAEIIEKTNDRVVSDPPDVLFLENINFYTKSYLINLCAITEACLKDTAMLVMQDMSGRVSGAKIAHNLIMWSIYKDNYEESKHSSDNFFSLSVGEREISEKLSANPWRAIKLFQFFGCKLDENAQFIQVKNIVGSVVNKRNNIVHHNDQATDLSLADVRGYIDSFKKYISGVVESSEAVIVSQAA